MSDDHKKNKRYMIDIPLVDGMVEATAYNFEREEIEAIEKEARKKIRSKRQFMTYLLKQGWRDYKAKQKEKKKNK